MKLNRRQFLDDTGKTAMAMATASAFGTAILGTQRNAVARELSTTPVIYIHGIGNQASKNDLKNQWDKALFGDKPHSQTQMAYWADILHPMPQPTVTRDFATTAASSGPPLSDEKLVTACKELVPGDTDSQQFAEELALQLLQPNVMTLHSDGRSGKFPPVPLPSRDKLYELFVKQFVRDNAAYFCELAVRKQIQQRLRYLLSEVGEPCVLVAHSQGTIIAYDVLSEPASTKLNVRLFVTLGSPLGLKVIRNQVTKPLQIPKPVTRWCNFAARFDPVAHDARLSDKYAPVGMIVDRQIDNPLHKRTDLCSAHYALGYLAAGAVQQAIVAGAGS